MLDEQRIKDGILFLLGHINDLDKKGYIKINDTAKIKLTEKGYKKYLELKEEGFTLLDHEITIP